MNALERMGISHLSASSLNLWRSSPGIWGLRYLARLKDQGNAAMWRGTAVENGLTTLLRSKDLNAAKAVALQNFDMNCQGETSEDIDAERELIEPMIDQCLRWQPPSDLNATQLKIEHWLEGIPVPIIGYLDLAFDGIDVDCKTTKACPSTPRADHVRQVSLYRAARGRNGGLLYVTKAKHAYFDVDDNMMERALGDMQADALSLCHFLARCNSPKEAMRCLPIDYDHYAAPKVKVPLEQILLAG